MGAGRLGIIMHMSMPGMHIIRSILKLLRIAAIVRLLFLKLV